MVDRSRQAARDTAPASLENRMDLITLALPQEPADGIAGWAADLVDTMGGPG